MHENKQVYYLCRDLLYKKTVLDRIEDSVVIMSCKNNKYLLLSKSKEPCNMISLVRRCANII